MLSQVVDLPDEVKWFAAIDSYYHSSRLIGMYLLSLFQSHLTEKQFDCVWHWWSGKQYATYKNATNYHAQQFLKMAYREMGKAEQEEVQFIHRILGDS